MTVIIPRSLPERKQLEHFAKLMPELDPGAVQACLLMLQTAARCSNAADQYFSKYNLSEGRFSVLIMLYRECTLLKHSDALSPAELAEMLDISRASVSGLLDSLKRDKLVSRKGRNDDRRKIDIKLTKKGEAILLDILPEHYRRINKIFNAVCAEEKETLIRILLKISSSINLLNKDELEA